MKSYGGIGTYVRLGPATDSADPTIPSIPWRGSGYYVEALHGQQPCGNHILERIFVAVRWYGTPADHPEPHDPTVATARFDTYEAADAFAHRLRIRLLHATA